MDRVLSRITDLLPLPIIFELVSQSNPDPTTWSKELNVTLETAITYCVNRLFFFDQDPHPAGHIRPGFFFQLTSYVREQFIQAKHSPKLILEIWECLSHQILTQNLHGNLGNSHFQHISIPASLNLSPILISYLDRNLIVAELSMICSTRFAQERATYVIPVKLEDTANLIIKWFVDNHHIQHVATSSDTLSHTYEFIRLAQSVQNIDVMKVLTVFNEQRVHQDGVQQIIHRMKQINVELGTVFPQLLQHVRTHVTPQIPSSTLANITHLIQANTIQAAFLNLNAFGAYKPNFDIYIPSVLMEILQVQKAAVDFVSHYNPLSRTFPLEYHEYIWPFLQTFATRTSDMYTLLPDDTVGPVREVWQKTIALIDKTNRFAYERETFVQWLQLIDEDLIKKQVRWVAAQCQFRVKQWTLTAKTPIL
jgi:hypothetical protein